jgi:cytochrome c553
MKILIAASAFALPLYCLAQPASVETCVACHGTFGQGQADRGAPRLAGQPAAYLARQLAAFADGSRVNADMSPIAKGIKPERRAELASYYSGLQAPAAQPSVKGAANARGRALATRGDDARRIQSCNNCHGPGGAGLHDTPYLAGLDRAYIESALREWKSGKRRTDSSQQMPHIAKGLSEADIKAVAAHYAGLYKR